MPGQESHRPVPGRHTLGSPPESQEPLDHAIVLALPSLSPLDNLTYGAEPFHTIYRARWHAARQRARARTGVAGRQLVRLLDLFETGWQGLRDLQTLVRKQRHTCGRRRRLRALGELC